MLASPEEAQDDRAEREVLMVYAGQFESMDGPVSITDDHLDRLVSNHNSKVERLKRLVAGNPSVKGYPPLQVDHSSSAMMTIGRVTGALEKRNHNIDEDTVVSAIFGKVTILGAENVARVRDGRWQDVSIGADLDTGKLNELSITPFPAAVNASILKARGEGDTMFAKFVASLKGLFNLTDKDAQARGEKMKAHLMTTLKLSAEDAEKKLGEMPDAEKKDLAAKCADPADTQKMADPADTQKMADPADTQKMKGYLTGYKKMTEDEAMKHLGGLDDDGKKKLAAEVDEHEKKMAAQDPKIEREEGSAMDEAGKAIEKAKKAHESEMAAVRAELTAAKAGIALTAEKKESFIKLAKSFKETTGKVQMAARKAQLSTRLAGLKASAKITPAEIKKMDLEKLASENDATVEAVFKTYESREPVILAGILGSAKAQNLSELAASLKTQDLEHQSRMNMPLKKKAYEAELASKGTESTEPKRFSSLAVEAPVEVKLTKAQYETAYSEVVRLMKDGKLTETALRGLFDQIMKEKNVGDGGLETVAQVQTQMSALADSVKTLHTQFQELVKFVGPNLGVETSEI